MAILDFLFNGSPPPQVSSYSSTSTNFPDWYAAYSQGLLSKANAVAAEPYQAYTGPRVAGFTPDQNAAFNAVRTQQGGYAIPFDFANMYTKNAADASGANVAQPFYNDATSNYNPITYGQPFINAASGTLPDNISSYMSPYTSLVTDRIAQLGQRNLSENLLPAVNDTFTGLGQFGSRRHGDFTERALRDTNESILGQQAQALEQGYQTAGQQFQADQSRLANLGQLSGQLAQSQAGNLLTAGTNLGNLTGTDAARMLQAGQQMGALGQLRQSLGYQDAAALEAVGQTQQQQGQKNLDTAYQDFLEQRSYPRSGLDILNQALRGVTPPTTTTQSGTGPGSVFQPSPLAQLAGAGLTYSALSRAGLFKHGGPVRMAGGGNARRILGEALENQPFKYRYPGGNYETERGYKYVYPDMKDAFRHYEKENKLESADDWIRALRGRGTEPFRRGGRVGGLSALRGVA